MADTAGMALLRTDIIRALDELINNEAGTSFQALAVVLAKQKWTDLIASEWHNDGGLDAYAPASLAEGKKAKGAPGSSSLGVISPPYRDPPALADWSIVERVPLARNE